MFVSAFFSFILYLMIFFRLRGNIVPKGWRLKFRRRKVFPSQAETTDSSIIAVAKMMLLYPIAYTIMILPIAVCRFADWTGHEIPFAVTIFSDSIFLLSGLVNVILFTTTRRVLPQHSVIPHRFSRSLKSQSTSSAGSKTLIDEDIDLEKSKDKFQPTYIDHDNENWAGKGTNMFKTVDSPDDDGRSDYSYPSRSNSLPTTDPVQMPVPQHNHNQHDQYDQYPHPPGVPRHSPGEDRFERVSLDSSSATSSPRFEHHHEGHDHDRSEPESPLVATDYILRSPSSAGSKL
ncbi:hypothetical protein QCA50_011720 [Cerrena zonata]|uniref:G-protein coupled receptors family 1 profile domain-containing protein n=1 Tax=Cerrena zonata TaxID=2478898 RepID=A0AAW0FWS0_9APHY